MLSQRSHQGIETNSYVVRAQATGRHMVRSERNICPVAAAKVGSTGSDPNLSQDVHASAVLYNDSVPCKPTSILKSTLCEGSWLSHPTQHAPAPALTTGGLALSALKHGLQAPSQPSIHPGTPSRPRRVQTSPIISIIDTCGVERFQKE